MPSVSVLAETACRRNRNRPSRSNATAAERLHI
jgi:hypothetical protein